MTPLVSIIVPCYGVEKYLNRCVDSLLCQSLKNIEIILVDDGSLDNVPTMCEEWKHKDSRIKVIHKKNEGLGLARNSGLEIASGEYVAFVDSDDYVSPDMYCNLYKEAVKSEADAVFCGFKTELSSGIWCESNEVFNKEIIEGKSAVESFMLDMVASAPFVKKERRYQMSVWHSIYRHSVIKDENLRFLSERKVVSEDIPFQIEFLKRASKIVYLPNSYYYYCFNGSSLTASYKEEKYAKYKTLYETLLRLMSGIKGTELRVNRLFIGYVRSDLLQLFKTNSKNKKQIIERIVKDDIWSVIKQKYRASYLPFFQRLIYVLIISKHSSLLRYVLFTITKIRK